MYHHSCDEVSVAMVGHVKRRLTQINQRAAIVVRTAGRVVMAQTATTDKASGATRLDRRKARTRQALIDAAAELIAQGRGSAPASRRSPKPPTSGSGRSTTTSRARTNCSAP